MTSGKSILMLIMAAGFAGFAGWGAMKWMDINARSAVAVEEVRTEKVVVATVDIAYGQEISEKHLKLVDWPKDLLPPSYFGEIEQLLHKITKKNIAEGAVFNEKWVVDHLEGSRLAALIENNKRAMSVRVDDVVGVAGFILPGNRVDVLGVKKDRKTKEIKVDTVLENIKVLAVDQEVSPDADKPKVVRAVTLELSPDETETIVKSMHEGKIQIALRNPDEQIVKKSEIVEEKAVEEAVAVAPQEKKRVIPTLSPRVKAKRSVETQVANIKPVLPPKVTIIRGLDVSKEDKNI